RSLNQSRDCLVILDNALDSGPLQFASFVRDQHAVRIAFFDRHNIRIVRRASTRNSDEITATNVNTRIGDMLDVFLDRRERVAVDLYRSAVDDRLKVLYHRSWNVDDSNRIVLRGIRVFPVRSLNQSRDCLVILDDLFEIDHVAVARLIDIRKGVSVVVDVTAYIGIMDRLEKLVLDFLVVDDLLKVLDNRCWDIDNNARTRYRITVRINLYLVVVSIGTVCVRNKLCSRLICFNNCLKLRIVNIYPLVSRFVPFLENNVTRSLVVNNFGKATCRFGQIGDILLNGFKSTAVYRYLFLNDLLKVVDHFRRNVNNGYLIFFVGVGVRSVIVFNQGSFRFVRFNNLPESYLFRFPFFRYIGKSIPIVVNITTNICVVDRFEKLVLNSFVINNLFEVLDNRCRDIDNSPRTSYRITVRINLYLVVVSIGTVCVRNKLCSRLICFNNCLKLRIVNIYPSIGNLIPLLKNNIAGGLIVNNLCKPSFRLRQIGDILFNGFERTTIYRYLFLNNLLKVINDFCRNVNNSYFILLVGICICSVIVFYQRSFCFVCLNNISNRNLLTFSLYRNVSKFISVIINITTYISITQYFN